ncbi:ribose ABC transporter permease [Fodinisporobacter ferrooxydans]|uniref:Ribose ABC transporter permease n=1 Tax=Fodinisporobacter ferrooxydans TaxID=2901836 RepID=A0ABY4CR93_9BACL|nr:ribose ABC transporter permease [Alicyclobacillaceae bacterium MYW30-H2]
MSIASSRFLTFGNLSNIALQTSINALLAVGMTFVILTSGIDLSVGAILALSGSITAGLITHGTSPFLAAIAGLLVGVVAGLFNGILVGYGRLAAFIVTLGTMTLFRGLTEIYTHGMPIFNLPLSFMKLGTGYFALLPTPVWIMFLVFVIGWVMLNRMTLGRRIYAVGGNEDAAFLAGVPVKKYLVTVYVISGFLAALAGLILTARLGSAEPNAGTGYELDAITAVVLGGTSLFGGEGTLIGTIIGAFILGVISNGLNLLNVNAFYQDAIKGIIILIAIMLDRKKISR